MGNNTGPGANKLVEPEDILKRVQGVLVDSAKVFQDKIGCSSLVALAALNDTLIHVLVRDPSAAYEVMANYQRRNYQDDHDVNITVDGDRLIVEVKKGE